MNTHIFLVSVSLFLILIFMHDLKSVEIKIMGNDYPNVENLQKQYDECLQNQKEGRLCDIILKDLNKIKNNKPSILSSFFVWVCDGFNTIFKTLSIQNLGLAIILIIFFKIFFKYA